MAVSGALVFLLKGEARVVWCGVVWKDYPAYAKRQRPGAVAGR